MRLEKIKLSGFKSFVDTTIIPLPSNLAGIVGPNGCGKSNVIDAVRWVMGESSAKHLRGESMSDVIFNGSASRKPVGQAFVELLFDNSDGTITGEYAAYREISLKRSINREGQSTYFLNGTRCRRKDITDLFLGTGLGSRSYAIIEQGTISRLVEAKPEELRVYIEEAAGISKYKERRRDTENRIRRTRENLDRIADLCEEIGKQCRHLKRQAGVAEKYKSLKAEDRELKSRLLALRWKELDTADFGEQQKLDALQTKVDEVLAEQRGCEKKIEVERDAYNQQREKWTAVQANFYAIGSEIAKVEQSLQQHKGQLEQQKRELSQAEGTLNESQLEQAEGKQRLEGSQTLLQEAEAALTATEKDEVSLKEALLAAELAMTEGQKNWDEFTHQVAEPKRQIDVEKVKIDQLERHLVQLGQRIESASKERTQHQQLLENEGFSQLQEEHGVLHQQHHAEMLTSQAAQKELAELGQQIHEKNEALAKLRAGHAQGAGRLASIEVLQQSGVSQWQENVQSWLENQGLQQLPSLIENLNVQAGWEKAFEAVLGGYIKALCLDDLSNIYPKLDELPEGNLVLLSLQEASNDAAFAKTSIVNLVTSSQLPLSLLRHVHFAETLQDAQQLLASLDGNESVVTKNGVWLNSNFIFVSNLKDGISALSLEKEKQELTVQLNSLSTQTATSEQAIFLCRERLSVIENARQVAQQSEVNRSKELVELANKLNEKSAKSEHAKQRLVQLKIELSDAIRQQEGDKSALALSRKSKDESIELSENVESKRASIQQQLSEQKTLLEAARLNSHAAREQVHSYMLKIESQRSACALISQNEQNVVQRIEAASKKIKELGDVLALGSQPLEVKEKELAELLGERLKVEASLSSERLRVEKFEQTIRETEKQRHQLEQRVQVEREDVSTAKISHQEVLVRKQTLVEQLQASGLKLEEAINDLPEGSNEGACQSQIDNLTKRIDRLGPINLTAIEEYDTQLERKTYLDSQQEDLNESLLTLEKAIEKIDIESRALFKATFTKVNEGFAKRFPKLFGGGKAYLQQLGDDMLESGITVMAQPPGKRNTSIHLLSGGEKALTAVALVFAIFDLNPSPFCMLDEVDAPLDEANVERFGELVKEMSEYVQMILITHNKATMEIVQQLAGVTMKEPGVSRLVAVDLEEAAKMAVA
ncbi:MAG: chromosome segregation protein SMC [Cycloclasticus sp. symbiont of Poecilosclerida sp. M]|nr:MAG: chromosome segregation protein SMC [Cycloclasticus sp. symbiont of Poecilosclerida sp. M]